MFYITDLSCIHHLLNKLCYNFSTIQLFIYRFFILRANELQIYLIAHIVAREYENQLECQIMEKQQFHEFVTPRRENED